MKKEKQHPLRLLLKWAGRDKYYLYASILCSACSGICSVGLYLGLYQLMDAVICGSSDAGIIIRNAVLITVTTIARLILMGGSGVLSHKGAYNALFRVRCMVTEHMAKVPLGVLNERGTGEIKTILNEDIEKLELCLAHNLPDLVSYMTGPLVIFIYLLTVNVPLALVSLLPLPLVMVVMAGVFKTMTGLLERANRSLSAFNAVMIEYISGMKLIKAFGLGSRSFTRFADAVDEENRIWKEMSRKMGPPYAAFTILLECGILLLVPLGGLLFLRGSISSSVLLLFVYVGSLYLTEILPLQQLANTFARVLNAITRTEELLALPVYQGGRSFPSSCSIEAKHVGFSYDGSAAVLKDCSFRLENGEKMALVGPSGAGKSTLVQLIARFYDSNQGQVLIGGVDVREIRYEELLRNISIVFQKTFLTRESVFENIRMGSDATLEQVRDAAAKAQIDDFIMSLPEGYQTRVGSFGSRFSGGERQRIAIARAILKNAPILILDEATSAADPENQVEIDNAIRNLCRDKTVIIVAHRLGVVSMCDKVAVVENQTVTAFGSHEQTLQNSAYYRNGWNSYRTAREITYSLEGADDHAGYQSV